MPTISPQTTPYYGGGQAINPANVVQITGAPSTKLTEDKLGTLAIINSTGTVYVLASKSGGVNTWNKLESSGGAGSFTTLTSTSATTLATTGASVNTFGNNTGTTSVSLISGSGGISLNGRVSLNGITTNTSQPCFLASQATGGDNVTGDATAYTLLCDNILYDQNSNYSSETGMFTAPVAGKYLFICSIFSNGYTSSNTYLFMDIITTTRTYGLFDTTPVADNIGYLQLNGSAFADMAAGNTAYVTIEVGGNGSKNISTISDSLPALNTFFQGYLVC